MKKIIVTVVFMLALVACSTAPPPAMMMGTEQVTHLYQSTTTVRKYAPGRVGTIQNIPADKPFSHYVHVAILNQTDQNLDVYVGGSFAASGWGPNVAFLPIPPPDPTLTIKSGQYGWVTANFFGRDQTPFYICFRSNYGFGGAICRIKKLTLGDMSPGPPLWFRIFVAGSGATGFNGAGWSIGTDVARIAQPRQRIGTIHRGDVERQTGRKAPPPPAPADPAAGFVP